MSLIYWCVVLVSSLLHSEGNLRVPWACTGNAIPPVIGIRYNSLGMCCIPEIFTGVCFRRGEETGWGRGYVGVVEVREVLERALYF